MQTSGDNEGGPTQSGGSPAKMHPVPLHAMHKTQSRVGNFGDFVAKLEQFGEPADVEAGVDADPDEQM